MMKDGKDKRSFFLAKILFYLISSPFPSFHLSTNIFTRCTARTSSKGITRDGIEQREKGGGPFELLQPYRFFLHFGFLILIPLFIFLLSMFHSIVVVIIIIFIFISGIGIARFVYGSLNAILFMILLQHSVFVYSGFLFQR